MEDRVKDIRTSRIGSQNPFYGRHHTDETKRKMSRAAKKRFEDIEKMKTIQNVTMDEFLANESVRKIIDRTIREEIETILWKIQN